MDAIKAQVDTRVLWRSGNELTAQQLHDLVEIRVNVFVVEQSCAYAEVDGHDLAATTQHGWLQSSEKLVAAVRILGTSVPQIGRLATHPLFRRSGLAGQLLNEAHERCGPTGSYLEAQTHVSPWYERHGWKLCGPEFVEDGIPHTPMRRPPAPTK